MPLELAIILQTFGHIPGTFNVRSKHMIPFVHGYNTFYFELETGNQIARYIESKVYTSASNSLCCWLYTVSKDLLDEAMTSRIFGTLRQLKLLMDGAGMEENKRSGRLW